MPSVTRRMKRFIAARAEPGGIVIYVLLNVLRRLWTEWKGIQTLHDQVVGHACDCVELGTDAECLPLAYLPTAAWNSGTISRGMGSGRAAQFEAVASSLPLRSLVMGPTRQCHCLLGQGGCGEKASYDLLVPHGWEPRAGDGRMCCNPRTICSIPGRRHGLPLGAHSGSGHHTNHGSPHRPVSGTARTADHLRVQRWLRSICVGETDSCRRPIQ